jgi:SNF2 family DNA or RNA helicase
MCDIALREHKLWEKGWRTNFTKVDSYIGLCDHTNKRIVISIPHLNARSEAECRDTIMHEIAHALVGHSEGHNEVWKKKAVELGAKPVTCSPSNVDKGRAIAEVERVPEQKIKAINLFCPVCHEVAVTKKQFGRKDKITGRINTILQLECGHEIEQERLHNPLAGLNKWTSKSGKVVYPYQVEGIRFVAKANGRALIADEPGLGKTIQATGSLYFYQEMRPALWICKSTLKLQALKEILDWSDLKMVGQIIQHGKMFIMPGMDVYIISMDLLRNMPTEKLEEIPYNTVIADEIQHFKNPDSSRTSELRKLVAKAKYFIPLSGTPWKNRGSEYYPVLNMLRSDLFPSPKHFRFNWVDTYYDAKENKTKEGGIRDIPKFREVTKGFIIRRMRDDVLPDLPKINRQVRFVDMDDLYAKSYDKAEGHVANLIRAAMIDGKPMKDIASIIMQLKHITGLAKVSALVEDVIEWLEDVPEDFEKLTIFHHHIDVGDNLQNGNKGEYDGIDKWLVENGYNKSLRLLGGRSPEERNRIVNDFQNDPKNRVMIASTLASGEGLNLQFCQNAYQLERQWNPQNEEQAEFRFSRPLTKSELPEYLQPIADRKISIRIPYYIAAGTVDEILTNIVERKRLNFRKSMNAKDEFITWDENEIMKELAEAIIKKRFKK